MSQVSAKPLVYHICVKVNRFVFDLKKYATKINPIVIRY